MRSTEEKEAVFREKRYVFQHYANLFFEYFCKS
jgi:hypothetical protein